MRCTGQNFAVFRHITLRLGAFLEGAFYRSVLPAVTVLSLENDDIIDNVFIFRREKINDDNKETLFVVKKGLTVVERMFLTPMLT